MPIRTRTDAHGNVRHQCYINHVVDGRKVRTTVGTYATKKQARLAEAEARVKLSGGELIERHKAVSVGSLADFYLETVIVGKRSRAIYATNLRHARDYFGDTHPAKAVKRPDVMRYVTHLIDKGLAPRTVRHAVGTLFSAFQTAVDSNLLQSNPVAGVKTPRVPKTTVRVMSPEEHQSLVQATPEPFRTLVAVWPYLGLRRSEVIGLTWDRVDLAGRKLTVDRQYVYGRLGPLKTENSNRTVLLVETVVKTLREWRLACPPSEEGWVFPSARGCALNANFFDIVLPRAAEEAGLEGFTAHAFRHTFAAWMLAITPIKYVQHQMGHANPTTTLNTYGHLIPDSDTEILGRVDEWVSSRKCAKSVTSRPEAK